MTRFDPTAGHLIVPDNLLKALLADRAQREMVIKQPAQQLPPVTVKTLLQTSVIQTSRISPVHETDQRLELLTAGSEPSRRSRPLRSRPAARSPATAPSPPRRLNGRTLPIGA